MYALNFDGLADTDIAVADTDRPAAPAPRPLFVAVEVPMEEVAAGDVYFHGGEMHRLITVAESPHNDHDITVITDKGVAMMTTDTMVTAWWPLDA